MGRRFASARAHNWLIHALIQPPLEEALRRYARGRLADVGCGAKPYVEAARPFVSAHLGFDRSATRAASRADVAASAYEIPAEDASFATLLCTDVLEHLEEPGQAIAEAFRVLEPGGHAIYTVPLHWHLHEEPRDFYRFTSHGLRYLLEKGGFEVVEIAALTGIGASVAQALSYWLYGWRRGGPRNPLWWIVPPLSHLVQALGWIADRLDRSERFTAEYLAIARKPAP